MKTKILVATAITLSALGTSAWSANTASSPNVGPIQSAAQGDTKKAMPMGDMGMMHGAMMQGGMMQNCPMMQLPPGNEKLSMQMHADMMQAMGEILRKYADKLDTSVAK